MGKTAARLRQVWDKSGARVGKTRANWGNTGARLGLDWGKTRPDQSSFVKTGARLRKTWARLDKTGKDWARPGQGFKMDRKIHG